MTYGVQLFDGFHDAESQDDDAEQVGNLILVQNTSGRQQTGDYGFSFVYSVLSSGDVRMHPGVGAVLSVDRIIAVSAAWGLSTAPSKNIGIFGRNATSSVEFVQINPNRQLEFFDQNGTLLATSTTTIPTTGMQEVHIFYDVLTTGHVFVKVYFGATEELAFDTGQSQSEFFDEGVGTWFFGGQFSGGNAGAVLYGDDLVIRLSTTAGDAPHSTDYPRMRGIGGISDQPPDADGTGIRDNWDTAGSTGCTDKFDCVDETGGHDAGVTFLEEFDKGEIQTFISGVANPIPTGPDRDVVFTQLRNVGKRTEDKLGAHFYIRTGGSVETHSGNSATPAESYTGGLWTEMPKPGGGSWAHSDADPDTVEFGWESEDNVLFETGAQVTLQGGPVWIYSEGDLASGTTPFNRGIPELDFRGIPRQPVREVVAY